MFGDWSGSQISVVLGGINRYYAFLFTVVYSRVRLQGHVHSQYIYMVNVV